MGEEPEDRKGIAMGFPRDYYRDEYGEPSLHSLHGSRPYVERDNLADMAHDQLPTLSTIGAGPQGAGVIPVPVVGEPGSYRFQLVSDETGEVLLTSDNLHPGEISVWSPAHEWVAGEAETVYIRVRKGDEVDEYPIEIPPGAVGSRWFVGPEAEYSSSNVYYFQVGDLQYDGLNAYRGKPVPRPNDLCAFRSGHDLVLGNVDACEAGTVVVVARTYIPVPVPEIGENGNWMVDGVDTGQPSKGDRGDDGLNAVVRIGNVEALPPGKASATMNVDVEKNVYTLNLGIPEGAPGKAIDIQGGIWTTDTLPDYDNTEVNTAFIVHDNDKQFDLYIRGRIPVTASDGGPWTVVEDWQGRPGTGPHMLKKPYVLGRSEGSIVRVPAAELSLAFAPYDHMSDGDVVIDTEMSVGILGSTEDDSGDYTVETMGTVTARWENVEGKPFDTVLDGDGLVVTEASMDGEAIGKVLNMDPDSLSPKWDMVREKPSSFPAKVDSDDRLLSVDVDGVLKSGNVEWSTIVGKPSTYPHDEVRWDEVTGKPESFGIQVACTAVAEESKKWLAQGEGDAWELGAKVELIKGADALLTTDAIARSDPADLTVYDEGGKLKVSETAVASIAQAAAPAPPAKEFVELQNYWFADDGLHLVLFSKMTADGFQVVLKQSGADPYGQTVLEEIELNGNNQVTNIVMDLSDQNGKSFDPSIASTVFVQGRAMADGLLGNNTNTAASFVLPAKEAAGGDSDALQAYAVWHIANNALVINGSIPGYKADLFPWGVVCTVSGNSDGVSLPYPNGNAITVPVTGEMFTLALDLTKFGDTSLRLAASEPDSVNIIICAGGLDQSEQIVPDTDKVLYMNSFPIVRPITQEYIQSLFAS